MVDIINVFANRYSGETQKKTKNGYISTLTEYFKIIKKKPIKKKNTTKKKTPKSKTTKRKITRRKKKSDSFFDW